jgi:hypothetical protein
MADSLLPSWVVEPAQALTSWVTLPFQTLADSVPDNASSSTLNAAGFTGINFSDSVADPAPTLPILLLEILALLYIFGCLAIAAERLCDAMETLCRRLKIPEDVAGATFMVLDGSEVGIS